MIQERTRTRQKTKGRQALFDGPRYGWKSVQQIERQDMIVVAAQETGVLGIRQEGGIWWISFLEPETGSKTEQFYNAQDFIYVRLKQEGE